MFLFELHQSQQRKTKCRANGPKREKHASIPADTPSLLSNTLLIFKFWKKKIFFSWLNIIRQIYQWRTQRGGSGDRTHSPIFWDKCCYFVLNLDTSAQITVLNPAKTPLLFSKFLDASLNIKISLNMYALFIFQFALHVTLFARVKYSRCHEISIKVYSPSCPKTSIKLNDSIHAFMHHVVTHIHVSYYPSVTFVQL